MGILRQAAQVETVLAKGNAVRLFLETFLAFECFIEVAIVFLLVLQQLHTAACLFFLDFAHIPASLQYSALHHVLLLPLLLLLLLPLLQPLLLLSCILALL